MNDLIHTAGEGVYSTIIQCVHEQSYWNMHISCLLIYLLPMDHLCTNRNTQSLKPGAYNNRKGPERTGMDRNAPEWASITGMDIKINLFYANKFIILP